MMKTILTIVLLFILGTNSYAQSPSDLSLKKITSLEKQLKKANNKAGSVPIIKKLVQLYREQQQFREAIRVLDQALENLKKEEEKFDLLLTKGQCLFELEAYPEALEILKTTIPYYRKDKKSKKFAESLFYTAHCYYRLHDYGTALDYLEEALSILKTKLQSPKLLAGVYRLMGGTYANLDDHIRSIQFIKKAADVFKKAGMGKEYIDAVGSLSFMYYRYEVYDTATYYAQLVIDEVSPDNYKVLADAYTTLHGVARLQKDFPKAINYAQMALDYVIKYYGERHPYTAYGEFYLGWTYREMGAWQKALPHLQNALIYNHKSFSDSSVFSFPDPEGILHLDYQMGFLDLKGECLEKSYQETKDIRYLEASFENYQLAVSLMDTLRKRYDHPETLLIHNEINAPLYLKAVFVMEQLYQLKDDPIYFELAFKYAEESKAFWLNRMLLLQREMQNNKDSTALVYQYLQSREDVQQLEQQISEKKVSGAAEEALFEQLNQTREKKDQLLDQLKKVQPAYYQQYFKHELASVEEIRNKLAPNTAMLSFVSCNYLATKIAEP